MLLYRILSVLALVAYSPVALFRSLTGRKRMGDLRGKLGLLPYPDLDGGIWVHAVSVGEVGVARNLLTALSKRAPGARLGLSVTTVAGLASARRLSGGDIPVFSFPLDLAGPVEKALSAVRPGILVLTETELWPLLIDRASRRGVRIALVNGRISERSLRRYGLVRRWFSRVLRQVSLFAMQSEQDAERIRALGAPDDRISVPGNIKYDLAPAPPFADAARLEAAAAGRPILVAGSTGPGEEEILLKAWKTVEPRPFLAIAPRRPERFEEVARLIESRGFPVLRRSDSGLGTRDSGLGEIQNPKSKIQNPPVYLLDSVGELASLYGQAALAFVGGSLIPAGGHNPIEAWAQGVAVVVGPHTGNFREITEAGLRQGILEQVGDGAALARAIEAAARDPRPAEARGAAASAFVSRSRGAAEATAEAIAGLLPGEPRKRAALP
jgi:3-deoxy-D-manno-octulosonic-acid transferase